MIPIRMRLDISRDCPCLLYYKVLPWNRDPNQVEVTICPLEPQPPFLPPSSSYAVVSYAPAPDSISSMPTMRVQAKFTQALHSVLGPIGPLLHSGVSVAPHPRHFGVFLSFPPLGAGRLSERLGVLALSGIDDGSLLLNVGLTWPCPY